VRLPLLNVPPDVRLDDIDWKGPIKAETVSPRSTQGRSDRPGRPNAYRKGKPLSWSDRTRQSAGFIRPRGLR